MACSKALEIPTDEYRDLSANERMEEFMFLDLRMIRGISISKFKERFGRDIYEVYARPLEKLSKDGLIMINGDNIRLTPHGIDVSNTVLANFLL